MGSRAHAVLVAAAMLSMAVAAGEPGENAVRSAIRGADASSTLADLTTLVRDASACCRDSRPVSQDLTRWLNEGHPIYFGRLPSEANQFRGFVLASLGAFIQDDDSFGYVRAGFLFADHPFDAAAAAVAARSFPEKSAELLPWRERYLVDTFEDSWVDVTTPEFNYPLAHPTRARHEILRTMAAFGSRAAHSLPRLDAIVKCPECGNWAVDAALPALAAAAAEQIRKASPPVIEEAPAAAEGPALHVIDKRERKPSVVKSLRLIDQEGEAVEFGDLRGRPFVLTFLYSQCPNPRKCVLTVRQLGELASECAASGLASRVGIYGMTYDPQFDSPSILKRYGSMYGMKFDRHVRLFKSTGELSEELRHDLSLRVNYGAGSVNQHGIQLFVFDKKGRLAAMQDNELWSPVEVRNVLAKLAAE